MASGREFLESIIFFALELRKKVNVELEQKDVKAALIRADTALDEAVSELED